MTDVVVTPPEGGAQATAIALLAAAEQAGLPVDVVKTSDGAFHVPPDVADTADLPDGATVDSTGDTPEADTEGTVRLPGARASKDDLLAFAAEHGPDGLDESLTKDELRAAITAHAARPLPA